MNWRMADKQLGCWIFCHGVVGFVFKFGSNWTNFDVYTLFLMGRGGVVCAKGVRDGVGSVRGLASLTKMKTFWVIKYLNIYSTDK